MSTRTQETWRTVHAERRQLAADLSDLSPEQWLLPSLCPGWDVHDVLAHLVDTARTGRVAFVRDLLRARMDFDRANEDGIARHKREDPLDTLVSFERAAALTRTPPARLVTRLVEAFVHGEDIRRPLGIPGRYPHGPVVEALLYQRRTPVAFGGGRERVTDLRLVDRGSGATWGAGEDVEGDAIDLLLAASGRPVDPTRLTGPGAPRLLGRTGAAPTDT